MASYFQSFQKSLLIYHNIHLGGQGLYFTGMIIWLFVPSLGTTDVMLQVDVLINFTQWALQDSAKVISALNDVQMQIRKMVYKTV